jgi:hypothetical protein
VESYTTSSRRSPVKTWTLNVLPLVAVVAALAAVVVYYIDAVAR